MKDNKLDILITLADAATSDQVQERRDEKVLAYIEGCFDEPTLRRNLDRAVSGTETYHALSKQLELTLELIAGDKEAKEIINSQYAMRSYGRYRCSRCLELYSIDEMVYVPRTGRDACCVYCNNISDEFV